jgi:hypothetical protein
MAQCMAMGQAAGTAAAMASAARIEPRDVPTETLRARLRSAGAVLELPKPAAPAAAQPGATA